MFVSILFFLFVLFMAILAIGGSLLRGVFNLLFGRRRFGQRYGHAGQAHHSAEQGKSRQTTSSSGKKREKIFDKTEGEYVDFEEIK